VTRPLLIAGARVLDPDGELDRPAVADVLVADGRIAAIGPSLAAPPGTERMDARGCLLTPGFVNAHSHSHDTLLRGLFEGLPLEAWGLLAFPSGWPRRSPAEVGLRATLHAAECLRGGITTVQDMVTIVGPDEEQAAAILEAYEAAGIRTVLAVQVADRAAADGAPFLDGVPGLLPASDPAPMQRFVGGLLDRTGPRLTWGLGPSAPQRCSDALLRWVAAQSRERGLPVFTHVYETRSQAVLARQRGAGGGDSFIETLARLGLLTPRLVAAHGVWITEAEVARLAAAGAHLACNPVANLKLLNGVAPVRTYADAGVNIALGCDNSSAGDAQSMFAVMKAFALAWALQSRAGESGAAAAAFRAATSGGAAALGLAGEVGTLRPGARADLVLFDLSDPAWWPLNSAVRQLVYAEGGRSVRTVLAGGSVVVRDGRLAMLDAGALAGQAEAARAAMQDELASLAQRSAALRDAMLLMHGRAAAAPLEMDRMRLAQLGDGTVGDGTLIAGHAPAPVRL
jgi:5-methylthioadenosine/S-adenosylhomocysteine deaminase